MKNINTGLKDTEKTSKVLKLKIRFVKFSRFGRNVVEMSLLGVKKQGDFTYKSDILMILSMFYDFF